MRPREHIIIHEGDGADLLPDVVVREPEPPRQLAPIFVGTGPGRGEYEAAVEVEYEAPASRAA